MRQMTLIRRAVLLGLFALGTFIVITTLAAAETSSLKLLVVNTGLEVNAGLKEGEPSHEVDRSLVIVDPLTSKVVGRVPLGLGVPHKVAASADGKLAFVTITGFADDDYRYPEQIPNGTICVIDLVAQKELRRVDIGRDSFPHGMVFVGGKLYFTAEGYKLVGRYDPESNRIDWMQGHAQLRGHEMVVNKDATKIFTANAGSNSVAAMELWDSPGDLDKKHAPRELWKVTPIAVGKEPEGMALSPDEKEVWTANRTSSSISIIDVATNEVKETLKLKVKEPYRLGFTVDGKRVLVTTRDTGDVLVLDAVTRQEVKRIMNVGARLHSILMAPDGSRAYIAFKGLEKTASPKNVAIIDLKTLEVTGYLTTGERPESLTWAYGR